MGVLMARFSRATPTRKVVHMTTTLKQPTTTVSTSAPRASLAIASDPGKALRLAPTFEPDVDLLIAEGVIAFGVKGSGKSNLLALIVEQIGRFFLPQIILDTEREYQSLVPLLPHGVLATAQRCPRGSDILHKGLQVVLDLQSWDTDEAAARAICRLVDELFTTTSALAPHERVPCVVHLDEAGYWLPQESVTYLSKETRKMLADAFHKLASRGRKQGLTSFLYTQSISEVAKSAIRQAGVKVLMRQTLDIDLTRYCQYIQGATARTKKAIQAYPSGKAIVILPDGSQHRVQFHERQSEHVSHTPHVQNALVKFATLEVDVNRVPMRDLSTHDPAPAETNRSPHQTIQTGKGRISPTSKTAVERVYDFLSLNPALRVADLVRLAECDQAVASKARKAFFEAHLDKPVAVQQAEKPIGKIEQQVRALLAENPNYSPSQLAHRTRSSSKKVRRLLQRLEAEGVIPARTPSDPTARVTTLGRPRSASSTTTGSQRPPLSPEVRERLEEAEQRLIEQGQPVTYERLAREAHIGYHAVATFLQEKRAAMGQDVAPQGAS
jgi:Winged helix-turn-helix DNA-binding